MKKYLKDLEKELRKNNLNEEEIEEILGDHEEMIQSAMNEGLSADELNTKFGNPKDVAEELSGFSDKVFDDDKESMKAKKNKKSDLVFNNIKEDYNVNIGLINEDLEIKLSDGEDISVDFIGRIDIDNYEIKYINNEFILKSPKKERNSYFGFSAKKKFIINLPKNMHINSFQVKLINGDAQLGSIFSNETSIKTNNGDIEVEDFKTKEFKLGDINGDIILKSVQCNNMKISTISGDLDIKDLKVKNDIFANTVSGDLKISDSECSEFTLKTVSGDVKATEFYPKKVSLSSVSGDVRITNTDENRPIVVTHERSVSGDVDIVLKQKKEK